MDEKFEDYGPDEAWLDDIEQGMESSAPSESLELANESQDADIEVGHLVLNFNLCSQYAFYGKIDKDWQ